MKLNMKAFVSIVIIICCIALGWLAYTIAPKPDETAELESGKYKLAIRNDDPDYGSDVTGFNYPPCNTVVFMGPENEATLELEWFPFESAVNFSMVMGERLETLTIIDPDGDVVWQYVRDEE